MYYPLVMPRNKKYGNNYWQGKGPKVGMRLATFYSDLEYDHWLMVEMDPDIEIYCEQPIKISFIDRGKLRSTVFDMWCRYRDGKEEFREIKYRSLLHPSHKLYEKTMFQINNQREWCQHNGFNYAVIDETVIRTSRYIVENRRKIIGLIRNSEERPYYFDLLKCITGSPILLCELLKLHRFKINELQIACSWLIYRGLISSNIDEKPFGYETAVWLIN